MSTAPQRAIRGRLLSFLDDPAVAGEGASHRYLDDGLLVLENGRIAKVGEARDLLPALLPEATVDHYPDALVMPGSMSLAKGSSRFRKWRSNAGSAA